MIIYDNHFFFRGQVIGDLSFCFGLSVGSLSNIYRNSGYSVFKEAELNKILFHTVNGSKHKHNFLAVVFSEI